MDERSLLVRMVLVPHKGRRSAASARPFILRFQGDPVSGLPEG